MDWDEDLIEVEPPKGPTNNPNSDQTNHEKQPSNLTLVPIRQPPAGWMEYRRCVINQSNTNGNGKTRDENPIDKIIIKGIRSISTTEFEEM